MVTSEYVHLFFTLWHAMNEHPRKHGHAEQIFFLHCGQWTQKRQTACLLGWTICLSVQLLVFKTLCSWAMHSTLSPSLSPGVKIGTGVLNAMDYHPYWRGAPSAKIWVWSAVKWFSYKMLGKRLPRRKVAILTRITFLQIGLKRVKYRH